MKSKLLLSAILASAATLDTCAFADNASQRDVKNGEEGLELRRTRDGDTSTAYVMQLVQMATVYRRNGELPKSKEAINKAISIEEKFPDRARMIPDILFCWSNELARAWPVKFAQSNDDSIKFLDEEIHQVEIKEAEAASKRAVAFLDAHPQAVSQRLIGHLTLFQFYENQNMPKQKNDELKVLDRLLRQAEAQKLSREELVETANILLLTADEFSPTPRRTSRHNQRYLPLTDENFAIAEDFRLRSIAMLDTLPTNDQARIEGNRDLARWYKMVSREEKEKAQTAKLEKLMGTTDQKLLFPPSVACGACGMG